MPSEDTLTFSNDLTCGGCHTACGEGPRLITLQLLNSDRTGEVIGWCVSLWPQAERPHTETHTTVQPQPPLLFSMVFRVLEILTTVHRTFFYS